MKNLFRLFSDAFGFSRVFASVLVLILFLSVALVPSFTQAAPSSKALIDGKQQQPDVIPIDVVRQQEITIRQLAYEKALADTESKRLLLINTIQQTKIDLKVPSGYELQRAPDSGLLNFIKIKIPDNPKPESKETVPKSP